MEAGFPRTPVGTSLRIPARAADASIPLTATQIRSWQDIVRSRSGISERVLHIDTRVFGPLNLRLFRTSVELVIQRHESLRSRFALVDGSLQLTIGDAAQYAWDVVDLSTTTEAKAIADATSLAMKFLQEQVDLATGPLIAVKIFKFSDQDHVVIVAMEHMITDMMSNLIVHREIWNCYMQAAKKTPSSLPKIGVHFPDYAVWQQQTHARWAQEHESYWRGYLRDAPAMKLPIDHHEIDDGQIEYMTTDIRFDSETIARLRGLTRQEKTSLAMAMLAVFAVAMSRWCRQRELLIAFVTHGRFLPQLINMVGNLANAMHLRVEITSQHSFMDVLKYLELELKSAYEHRDFDRVPFFVPECEHALCFDWVPSLQPARPVGNRSESADDIRFESFPLEVPIPRPFVLLFFETPTSVVATVSYERRLFKRNTIESLGHDLKSLAAIFSSHPCASLSALELAV